MQWWVKVRPLAKEAGDAVRDGRVRIHPEDMSKRYFDRGENLHDWRLLRPLGGGGRAPGLVHLASAVGGSPDPGLVRAGRRGRLRGTGRGAAERRGLDPGDRCPGHLVLLGPVAVLHARTARADGPTGELL